MNGSKVIFKDGSSVYARRTWADRGGEATVFESATAQSKSLLGKHGVKDILASAAAVAYSEKGYRTTKNKGQEAETIVTIEANHGDRMEKDSRHAIHESGGPFPDQFLSFFKNNPCLNGR